MREIQASQITDVVEKLCIEANEHLPEDVLKGIAEKAENKIGNYDTVEIYPDAPIQEILSGDKNGKDYHQELFEKLIAIFGEFRSQNYAKEQFEKLSLIHISEPTRH